MELNPFVRTLLVLVLIPPLFVIGIILLIWFWPSTPLPIEEVFLGACDTEFSEDYEIIDRPHSYAMFPQGAWYEESGEVRVPKAMAELIASRLKQNSEYKVTEEGVEKFVTGKVLAICNANIKTGVINYKYVLW